MNVNSRPISIFTTPDERRRLEEAYRLLARAEALKASRKVRVA